MVRWVSFIFYLFIFASPSLSLCFLPSFLPFRHLPFAVLGIEQKPLGIPRQHFPNLRSRSGSRYLPEAQSSPLSSRQKEREEKGREKE